jgi:hypothetical protein
MAFPEDQAEQQKARGQHLVVRRSKGVRPSQVEIEPLQKLEKPSVASHLVLTTHPKHHPLYVISKQAYCIICSTPTSTGVVSDGWTYPAADASRAARRAIKQECMITQPCIVDTLYLYPPLYSSFSSSSAPSPSSSERSSSSVLSSSALCTRSESTLAPASTQPRTAWQSGG